jgi:hypothetical protein
MKGSLATSTVLHAVVLGFALSSFTAPKTLEVESIESLPVSIVPIEELTQIQQGAKDAPLAETAAPVPTSRPDPVPDAQNTGENTVDLKPAETAIPSPREIVSEAPPKPAEKPAPAPEPAPEVAEAAPIPEPAPVESEPAPAEVAALPAEPTPDPVAEAIAEAAPAEPQFAALPSAGPVPQARPAPPKPAAPTQTASTRESDFNADEVAALLNKQDAAGGGARRSTETAALGGARTTRGNTLSQSEMDALRGQIQRFWNIIPGMADGGDVRVTVRMRLDVSGNIVGQPDVSATGGSAGTAERSRAAPSVRSCGRSPTSCRPKNTIPGRKSW